MTSALPRGLARVGDVVISLQLLLPVFLITNKCINLDKFYLGRWWRGGRVQELHYNA